MKKYYALKGIKIGIFFFGMVALGGLVVMSLWNWLAPSVFGLSTITWAQALGLLVLSRILFGSWGGGPRGRHRSHKREMWRKRMKQRFENMSPEEQARWKEKFAHRGRHCGWGDHGPRGGGKHSTQEEPAANPKDPFTQKEVGSDPQDPNAQAS